MDHLKAPEVARDVDCLLNSVSPCCVFSVFWATSPVYFYARKELALVFCFSLSVYLYLESQYLCWISILICWAKS